MATSGTGGVPVSSHSHAQMVVGRYSLRTTVIIFSCQRRAGLLRSPLTEFNTSRVNTFRKRLNPMVSPLATSQCCGHDDNTCAIQLTAKPTAIEGSPKAGISWGRIIQDTFRSPDLPSYCHCKASRVSPMDNPPMGYARRI